MTARERSERTEEIKQEMLEEWEAAPRNLGLIKEIHTTFCGFILHYHGDSLKAPYQIVYDERDPVEDELLNDAAEDLYRLTDRIKPGISSFYRGYTTATSDAVPGLRMIDWVAGEVRAFFYRNPELVGGDSTFEILSAKWNPSMLLINGGPFYPREISDAVRASFTQTGGDS